MPFTHPRMRRERQTIMAMFEIYCREQHALPAQELCPDCRLLQDYALERLDHCPFQENKSTCAHCLVHCYKRDMRERVRVVMRYAGGRMLIHHPVLAIRHLLDGRRKASPLPKRGRSSETG